MNNAQSDGDSSVGSHVQDIAERRRTGYDLDLNSLHASAAGGLGGAGNGMTERDVNEELMEVLRRKDADIDRLLLVVSQLTSNAKENSLEAIRLLREDVERREVAVTERETRLWGWRIVAAARDAELEQEIREMEERELQLKAKERALLDKELQLAKREEQLEQRNLLLNEEYVLQTRQLREELRRIKSRTSIAK
jgi:hypothetical protein